VKHVGIYVIVKLSALVGKRMKLNHLPFHRMKKIQKSHYRETTHAAADGQRHSTNNSPSLTDHQITNDRVKISSQDHKITLSSQGGRRRGEGRPIGGRNHYFFRHTDGTTVAAYIRTAK
jgi:hypothetical protein